MFNSVKIQAEVMLSYLGGQKFRTNGPFTTIEAHNSVG